MSKTKLKPSLKERAVSIFKNIIFFLVIFLILQTFMQRNMAKGIAPTFDTTSINGKSIDLDGYQGKPLLLHFWASWCPKCKFEEGTISDMNNDRDQVMTVAFQSGGANDVKQFLMKRNTQEWPVIVDQDGSLAEKYGVTGVPATFFIDSKGIIRFKTMGLTSQWGMKVRMWLTSFY